MLQGLSKDRELNILHGNKITLEGNPYENVQPANCSFNAYCNAIMSLR